MRGFDRFRVPLSLDGVRIYLPADNRLDFNRFPDAGSGEIQVAKGYVSVLNGLPAAWAAPSISCRASRRRRSSSRGARAQCSTAISTVSISGELRLRWHAAAPGYYAQVSGTIVDQDHFNLSDDFEPGNLVMEDGGARDHSESVTGAST